MQDTQILLNYRDSIAFITLNRPEARNAINLELARALLNVAMECDGNPTVRAVVLSGAGSTFSVGGDIKSFAAQGEHLSAYIKELITLFHSAVSCLARMNATVIAAVQGHLAGAGMSLACACDLVVAAESARFTAAYTRIGLTPDGSLTYFLSRCVGMTKRLLHQGWNESLETQMMYETQAISSIARSTDSQEGISAFLAKRSPHFSER